MRGYNGGAGVLLLFGFDLLGGLRVILSFGLDAGRMGSVSFGFQRRSRLGGGGGVIAAWDHVVWLYYYSMSSSAVTRVIE